MFDTDVFEYTEFWSDKKQYERLYAKVKKNWNKGIIYKAQLDKLNKLRNKLVYYAYPTYAILQRIGEY